MGHIKPYFKTAFYSKRESNGISTEVKFDNKRVLSFLLDSRSTIKGALMKWSYSQEWRQRRDNFVKDFKDFFGEHCEDHEFKTLEAFAIQFNIFLDELFPHIIIKKNLLIEVLEIREKANLENVDTVNIRTCDGCYLSWDVDPTTLINRGFYNPVTRNSKGTVKISIIDKLSVKAQTKRRRDLKQSLIPNIIHSIDGTIMRIIITKMFLKTNYRINHLHDCVLIHPNYVNEFYNVITEIYSSDIFVDLANKVYFEPMKEGLADNDKHKISLIQERFKKLSDDVKVSKETFNPRHLYVPEGTISNI